MARFVLTLDVPSLPADYPSSEHAAGVAAKEAAALIRRHTDTAEVNVVSVEVSDSDPRDARNVDNRLQADAEAAEAARVATIKRDFPVRVAVQAEEQPADPADLPDEKRDEQEDAASVDSIVEDHQEAEDERVRDPETGNEIPTPEPQKQSDDKLPEVADVPENPVV